MMNSFRNSLCSLSPIPEMSAAGDSHESTQAFYPAQFISDGRRQGAGANYYASHQMRTAPLKYGATAAPQQTTPLLSDREEKKYKFKNFVVYLYIAALFVLILVSIKPRQSILEFPQPMDPGEIEKYRKSGIYWDSPQPIDCGEIYHLREYVAQLHNVSLCKEYNMIKACEAMPIEILNHTLETPDECSLSGVHVYGHWTIYDPNDCTIEDEMQRFRKSGMYWDIPKPAQHCHSYDKREYEAVLLAIPPGHDRNKSCYFMPITIHDQVMEHPDLCEEHASGIIGKWIVSGQMDCKPFWGPLKDVGCQASGKKRYEAPLWNLIEGDDWYAMCESTPATWHGDFSEHPTNCNNRNGDGMFGIWESESC